MLKICTESLVGGYIQFNSASTQMPRTLAVVYLPKATPRLSNIVMKFNEDGGAQKVARIRGFYP